MSWLRLFEPVLLLILCGISSLFNNLHMLRKAIAFAHNSRLHHHRSTSHLEKCPTLLEVGLTLSNWWRVNRQTKQVVTGRRRRRRRGNNETTSDLTRTAECQYSCCSNQ